VFVSAEWADRLHPPRDDEEAQLDTVPGAGPASRLSCQILWTEDLDGLAVILAPTG
jgi:2Fe-2S ferredoxin